MQRPRHDFTIVIPVADRPRQLGECLDSLAALRERFPYAGAVSVLLADDSLDAAASEQNRALAEQHSRAGLPVAHLDRAAQRALVQSLPTRLRQRLADLLGTAASNRRLGASVMRNLALLWLARGQMDGRPRLVWFIDSDERFEVETAGGGTHPLDYLHTLDRLFRERPLTVLTGKVVGDPPVSPAVMARTLLDDVLASLERLTTRPAAAPCSLHDAPMLSASGAAYHDMADLFGYPPTKPAPYHCPLTGAHTHADSLADYVARLDRFFDGEHPSRRSLYEPAPLTLTPARTVYTGNYVVSDAGLDWPIPFASLGLRMAGPAFGRLLKAALGEAFVTASLPLQHGRVPESLGRSECRPGVAHSAQGVDISGEFERQYFGDVLLFSLEALIEQGYPRLTPAAEAIKETVVAVEARLNARYVQQQAAVAGRIGRLDALLADLPPTWQANAAAAVARDALGRFARALRHNFGPAGAGWRRVNAAGRRQAWVDRLTAALTRYPDAHAAWTEALAGR
ncbi:MAG: hypothetical protein ACK4TK_07775 [Thiobacillaceae bacterium]